MKSNRWYSGRIALFVMIAASWFAACGQSDDDDDSSSTATPTATTMTPSNITEDVPPVITPMQVGAHHIFLDVEWKSGAQVPSAVWCDVTDTVGTEYVERSSQSVEMVFGTVGQYEIYYLLSDTTYICTTNLGGDITVTTEPDVPMLQDAFQLAGYSATALPGYILGNVSYYDNVTGESFSGCVLVDHLAQVRAAIEINNGLFTCELLPHGRVSGGRPEILVSGLMGTSCVPENTYPEYDSSDGERMLIPANTYPELRIVKQFTASKTETEGGGGSWYSYPGGGGTCDSYAYGGGVTRVDLAGQVLMQSHQPVEAFPELQELEIYYDSHDAAWSVDGRIQALTGERCMDEGLSWTSFGRAMVDPDSGEVVEYYSGCWDGLEHDIDRPFPQDGGPEPTPSDDSTPHAVAPVASPTPMDDTTYPDTDGTTEPGGTTTPGSCVLVCDPWGNCICQPDYYGGSDYYHANTLNDDATSFYIGAKHTNYIVRVNKTTGEISYIGVDQGFTLYNADGSRASDSRWFFHAHDARVFYDAVTNKAIVTAHNNGTVRQEYDPTDPQRSSLTVYRVDFTARTATILLDWVPAPGGEPDYYWNQDIYGGLDRFVRLDAGGHAVVGAVDNGIPFEDEENGPMYRSGWPVIDETTGKLVWGVILPPNGSTYRARYVNPCDIPNSAFLAGCPAQ